MMTSRDKLRQQQALLRAEILRREENIHKLTDQLEENFGRLIFNSLLPVSGAQRHTISNTIDSTSGLLGRLMGTSGGKYELVFKGLRMVVSGLAWKYIRKLFK